MCFFRLSRIILFDTFAIAETSQIHHISKIWRLRIITFPIATKLFRRYNLHVENDLNQFFTNKGQTLYIAVYSDDRFRLIST